MKKQSEERQGSLASAPNVATQCSLNTEIEAKPQKHNRIIAISHSHYASGHTYRYTFAILQTGPQHHSHELTNQQGSSSQNIFLYLPKSLGSTKQDYPSPNSMFCLEMRTPLTGKNTKKVCPVMRADRVTNGVQLSLQISTGQ